MTKLAFGAVDQLVVQAETVRERPEPLVKRLRLDAGKRRLDTGIDVHAGQIVRVLASGKHCIGTRCFGPAGDPSVLVRTGDSAIHAGELAIRLGRRVEPVGAGRQFTSWTSGRLFVGIASEAASTGALQVTVEVYYPVAE